VRIHSLLTLVISIIHYASKASIIIESADIAWPEWLNMASEGVQSPFSTLLDLIPNIPDRDVRANLMVVGVLPFALFPILYKYFRFSGAFPGCNLLLRLVPVMVFFGMVQSIAGIALGHATGWRVAGLLSFSLLFCAVLALFLAKHQETPANGEDSANGEESAKSVGVLGQASEMMFSIFSWLSRLLARVQHCTLDLRPAELPPRSRRLGVSLDVVLPQCRRSGFAHLASG
jgi:hypothetical protein